MSDNIHDLALVLAAGKGTRMRSAQPKVLHSILGSPMLAYVLNSLTQLFGEDILIVSGFGSEQLKQAFPDARFVDQPEQQGTGDALRVALPALKSAGATHVTVINGDVPLISPGDIEFFIKSAGSADLAFATITLSDPGTYGRIVRKDGILKSVIEARDYDISTYGEPTGEVNAGLYRIRMETATRLIPQVGNENRTGEYYITSLIGLAIEEGLDVRGIPCGNDANFLGINTPAELSAAEDMLAAKVAQNLLAKGVMVHAPQMLRASPFATIEPGAHIWAPCEILGRTSIGSGARISFCTHIKDAVIEEGAQIESFTHIENATVRKGAKIGPYSRLRPGADIGEGAHVGNFVELKNATLESGAKANHLSYLGDASIGAGTNIGAGTITCNYDGAKKHRTEIGKNAFIGSNSALVAPVSVGSNAIIGAGSTITEDVPDNNLAIARARQINKVRK